MTTRTTSSPENRRDLRGLYVFSAWLNNTDVRGGNTLDAVINQNGLQFIRHYLIDFGSALGSDGDRSKDAKLGHEFMLPTPREAVTSILTLGLAPKSWERNGFLTCPPPDILSPAHSNPTIGNRTIRTLHFSTAFPMTTSGPRSK